MAKGSSGKMDSGKGSKGISDSDEIDISATGNIIIGMIGEDAALEIRKYTGWDYGKIRESESASSSINESIQKMLSGGLGYKGEVYRGMSVEASVIATYTEGSVISMGGHQKIVRNAPSSFSHSIGAAQDFALLGSSETEEAVIFTVKSSGKPKKAVPIENISVFGKEKEILYSGDTNFKITGSKKIGSVTHITMEEV